MQCSSTGDCDSTPALEEPALEGALEERSWLRPVKMKDDWNEDQVSSLGLAGN